MLHYYIVYANKKNRCHKIYDGKQPFVDIINPCIRFVAYISYARAHAHMSHDKTKSNSLWMKYTEIEHFGIQ